MQSDDHGKEGDLVGAVDCLMPDLPLNGCPNDA
jgi:hypothetical protein